jgi:hypothetical protein
LLNPYLATYAASSHYPYCFPMFLTSVVASFSPHHLRTLLLSVVLALAACQSPPPSPYRWTEFVSTRGHANPIPKPWVATPEGRFAHDLVIPNPVPVDSGYKPGMNADDYFRLLCEKEAGDFVFRAVENVEGLYFARPPKVPSDQDLMDRWKLENPRMEGKFQLGGSAPQDRAIIFVSPPVANYQFYEEPNLAPNATSPYWRLSGYRSRQNYRENGVWQHIPESPWIIEPITVLKARYGLTWRGIHRPHDRENGIAGGEIIAYDIQSNEILAVFRNYAYTGRMKNTPDGAWWLSAGGCRALSREGDHLFDGWRSRPNTVLIPPK